MLLLHPVANLSWTGFTVHPSTVIGLTALGGAYLWRAYRGPSRLDADGDRNGDSVGDRNGDRNGDRFGDRFGDRYSKETEAIAENRSPSSAQRASFFSALAIIFLTLNGPLHDLSDFYLFSAHMVQHLVLTLIVPPMLILGTPGWMLRPLLKNRAIFAVAKVLTTPSGCFLIFNIVLALWHLPPMYNLALASHPVHIFQHLMFIAAAVFMWWPLTSLMPELPRPSYPAQLMYCFLLTVPMGVIAIFISMAEDLLYPAYAIAPRIWKMSPLQDQQYGGLIMWIPGALFFYGVMTVVFFKWQQREGDKEESAEVVVA